MSARGGWFIAGLIFLALLALNAPKLAGALALLLVTYFAYTSQQKGLI